MAFNAIEEYYQQQRAQEHRQYLNEMTFADMASGTREIARALGALSENAKVSFQIVTYLWFPWLLPKKQRIPLEVKYVSTTHIRFRVTTNIYVHCKALPTGYLVTVREGTNGRVVKGFEEVSKFPSTSEAVKKLIEYITNFELRYS